MWFAVLVVAALIAFVVWFVRTPSFRARRTGREPSQRDQGRAHNPYEGSGPGGGVG
jgi:cytochrome c-type biogenesis protein CcmH/NrfG